jgi:cytochrome oxidase Cu insertion factor (SCO1/SenC/PrrC family)
VTPPLELGPRVFWRRVALVFLGLALGAGAFAAFLFQDFRARVARGEGVNNTRLRPAEKPLVAEGAEGALPAYAQVPDFALTERSGRPVTRADLAGKVWVVDFIFTNCTGQCPMMAARLKRLRAVLGDESPDVRLVSVTVDPARDTPEALRAYADALGVKDDRWLFLTGPKEAIVRLVAEGMKLPAIVSSDAAGGAKVDVTHSDRFVLVDRKGWIRGYYGAEDEDAQARLARDVRALGGGGRGGAP